MSGHLLGLTQAAITHTRTGEAITFYILAPIALVAALAMVFAKNAVHAALLLVVDFFCLAAFYALLDAPFLAAVQVIVYAGAIMILFLFVLMLVGVDSADSLLETLRGQRVAGLVVALGFIGLIGGALGNAIEHAPAQGLVQANSEGNVQGIAKLLFTTYVFPFEVTSALLIIAAMGAMVLGHRAPETPRLTQPEMMRARIRSERPGPRPAPGVYAGHDAVDRPALLPTGAPAKDSVFGEYRTVTVPEDGSPPAGAGEVER